jgi:hypothetical protein
VLDTFGIAEPEAVWSFSREHCRRGKKCGLSSTRKSRNKETKDAEERRGSEIIAEQYGDSSACAGAMKFVDSCY